MCFELTRIALPLGRKDTGQRAAAGWVFPLSEQPADRPPAPMQSRHPWLDIAAFPDSQFRLFGLLLRRAVLAFRVSRPVECKTVAREPVAQIGAGDRTYPHGPPIAVDVKRRTIDRSLRNKGIKVVGGLGAAPIFIAVLITAKLAAFRRVNTPEPNPHAVHLDRVTVDDADLPD